MTNEEEEHFKKALGGLADKTFEAVRDRLLVEAAMIVSHKTQKCLLMLKDCPDEVWERMEKRMKQAAMELKPMAQQIVLASLIPAMRECRAIAVRANEESKAIMKAAKKMERAHEAN